MKFIVDAQLPKSLARLLREYGHDAIHTLELPRRNRTDDYEINEISLQELRVVISKDSDFLTVISAKKSLGNYCSLPLETSATVIYFNSSEAISLPSKQNYLRPTLWK
ncbi:MAG: DUF5615 family PIN-like protein [Saprospiraceae bacterium]